MARVVQMIGLRRGEEDAVDARTEDLRQQVRAPGAEGGEHIRHGAFEIAHGGGAGVQRRERIDKHDLPVEPREVIAEERAHDVGLVGLVAALHHGGERPRHDVRALADRQRREGEGGRTFEIAGHEKAAGRQRGQGIGIGARGAQIGGEKLCRLARGFLGGRTARIERGEKSAPVGSERRACGGGARLERLARPVRIGLAEQWQVEQPLAGIVDEVDGHRRRALAPASGALEFQRQPQFGDAARGLWPVACVDAVGPAGQGGEVVFIGKARHGVVGLGFEPRPDEPSLGMGAQHGQAATANEIVDERGDEHRLAGARQASDAEAQARAGHIVRHATGGDTGFLGKI